jgi:hypothetical protein
MQNPLNSSNQACQIEGGDVESRGGSSSFAVRLPLDPEKPPESAADHCSMSLEANE